MMQRESWSFMCVCMTENDSSSSRHWRVIDVSKSFKNKYYSV